MRIHCPQDGVSLSHCLRQRKKKVSLSCLAVGGEGQDLAAGWAKTVGQPLGRQTHPPLPRSAVAAVGRGLAAVNHDCGGSGYQRARADMFWELLEAMAAVGARGAFKCWAWFWLANILLKTVAEDGLPAAASSASARVAAAPSNRTYYRLAAQRRWCGVVSAVGRLVRSPLTPPNSAWLMLTWRKIPLCIEATTPKGRDGSLGPDTAQGGAAAAHVLCRRSLCCRYNPAKRHSAGSIMPIFVAD